MQRLTLLLLLIIAACSQQKATSVEDPKRVKLDEAAQDGRCHEELSTVLGPDMFDHGIVTSADVAKRVATIYFRTIFAEADFPLDTVLQPPMNATLRDGIWYVRTTLPEGAIGVYLTAEICQSNGRMLTLNGFQ
jgi:hypothetical protein